MTVWTPGKSQLLISGIPVDSFEVELTGHDLFILVFRGSTNKRSSPEQFEAVNAILKLCDGRFFNQWT